MSIEIERKFVVDALPAEALRRPGVALRQGYLAEDAAVAVRIRTSPDGSVLTIKAGHGLSRTEVEVAIDPGDADALWVHTMGRRLEKVRHRISVDGGTAELDIYGGELTGLVTVEVEFASREDAEAFTPPSWFGAELTGDERWSNATLARVGRPRPQGTDG